jgi:hypothetical protein
MARRSYSLSATSHCVQLNTQVSVADWFYGVCVCVLVAGHISRKAPGEECNRLLLEKYAHDKSWRSNPIQWCDYVATLTLVYSDLGTRPEVCPCADALHLPQSSSPVRTAALTHS